MTLDEFQYLAARTINNKLNFQDTLLHALHGLSAEIGELHGIYQKYFQGHEINQDDLRKECGDILWMLCEYLTACGWSLEEIAQENIDKLRKRYPDGFSAERSVNRTE